MALYLLDTDTVSLLQEAHPTVTVRVAGQPHGDVVTTAITIEEQLSGWYTYLRRAARPTQIELAYTQLIHTVMHLATLALLPFTVAAIGEYDRLKTLKLNVGKNDLRIAAIALVNGAVVVTRNTRDFGRVPGLLIEDWSQPAAPPTLPGPPPAVP